MSILDWFKKKQPLVPLVFHNTLGNTREAFRPIGYEVRMYNCGPTVYGPQHIGNLSAAVFADILRRTFEYNGHKVKQVINITDFGHLTSDADEGEDKMSKGLRAAGKAFTMENMHELATLHMEQYFSDIRALNVDTDKILFPRASEHVSGQIALIKTLVEKGYAYETSDGVYFETSRFPTYGELGGIHIDALKAGNRVDANTEKHQPTDFALWKKNSELGWDSPWGKGFPGWHIECSAMILALLGKQIDIHTGGVEHIAVHHNNEIAQAEAATGRKPFSRFWLHREHIQLGGAKMAKSDGTVAYLSDVVAHSIDPIALRYWFLTAHYRTPANFTWEALEASAGALKRLQKAAYLFEEGGAVLPHYKHRFVTAINDDLATPQAIALMWELMKDTEVSDADKKATLIDFDRVLGLNLSHKATQEETVAIPEAVQDILNRRKIARAAKDWALSDALREDIKKLGYIVTDNGDEQHISTD